MKKNKTISMWVYGTLKRGGTLHPHYMQNAEFKGTETISGELYKCNWYPIFFEKGDRIEDIIGERYKIPLEDFIPIRIMEENAGYKTKILITNKNNKCHVFCYTDKSAKKDGVFMTEF